MKKSQLKRKSGFMNAVFMFRRDRAGGISVFLSIALLATIVATGLLTDIARLGAAKNQAARTADIAVLSVLAGYETDLNNEYGLFAVHMPVTDASVFDRYTKLNLGVKDGAHDDEARPEAAGPHRALKLYDYRLEQSELTLSLPLSDVGVMERQILEYAKYRAPAAFISGIADFITQAGTASKMAEATKTKMEINRKLAEIGNEQQNLRDYIYGDLGTAKVGDKYVRNYNKNSNRDKLVNRIPALYKNYTDAARRCYEAETSPADGEEEISLSLYDRYYKAQTELYNAFDRLLNQETVAFMDANGGAAGCVEKIARASGELYILYDELDRQMDNLSSDDLETFLKDPMMDDVERGKSSLIDAQRALALSGALASNIGALAESVNEINDIRRELLGYCPPDKPADASAITQKLTLAAATDYDNSIAYEFGRQKSSGSFPDPRAFAADRVSELLAAKEDRNEKQLTDINTDMSGLPSRGNYTNEHSFEHQTESLINVRAGGTINYNPFDAGNAFARDALDMVIGCCGPVLAGLETIRDGLYVGEYALSIFNNAICEKYRWGWVDPQPKAAYLTGEVEYILHGNAKESDNMFWVKLQLFAIRFAMNFIHVHCDREKLELARSIAAALTAWAAETLAPLATELIIGAWSLMESISDVDDLLGGKRVPLIKRAGDWKTIIGIGPDEKQQTPEALKWSYLDYLRLFMLMVNRQTKIARMLDLIEINTLYAGRPLKACDLYCGAYGELTISVNYLFMSAPFMPKRMRAPGGRHALNAAAARDLF